MAAIARISQTNIVQAAKKHTATVFFFHGSGGTAEDIKEWVDILNKQLNRERLQFSHIKLVYPSAPSQPYTPNGGMMQNVWFDRIAISNRAPEHLESIDSMCKSVSELIDKEHLKENPEHNKVPLIQYHGTFDTLVPIEWGEESAENLKDVGVNVKFVPLKNVDHELNREEIQNWKDWLLNILPDK